MRRRRLVGAVMVSTAVAGIAGCSAAEIDEVRPADPTVADQPRPTPGRR